MHKMKYTKRKDKQNNEELIMIQKSEGFLLQSQIFCGKGKFNKRQN